MGWGRNKPKEASSSFSLVPAWLSTEGFTEWLYLFQASTCLVSGLGLPQGYIFLPQSEGSLADMSFWVNPPLASSFLAMIG